MPLCGIDDQMLDGLSMFKKGLMEAVIRKSEEYEGKLKFSITHAINEELQEMDEFLEALPGISDECRRQKLEGIIRYAQAFYQSALKRYKEEGGTMQETMETEIKETRTFLYEVDKAYEEQFKGQQGSLRKLALWIEYDLK